MGGASSCTGTLELNHYGEWKAVDNIDFDWSLKVAAVICRWLDCGSSVSTGRKMDSSQRSVWWINSSCVQSKSSLRECVTTRDKLSSSSLELTCSGNTINDTYGRYNVTVLQDKHVGLCQDCAVFGTWDFRGQNLKVELWCVEFLPQLPQDCISAFYA